MAYSPTEEAFLSRLTAVQFPDQPVEPETAPSVDGMQLAAGPSQTVSDAGAGRGSYAGFDPRLDVANKGAQPEMRAYDPTTRERIASFLQAGFEGLGMNRVKARQNAQTLIGGPSSNLPLDMGIADIVPFLGTGLQTEEAVRMGGEAVESAKAGNIGTAALQAGGAALGLVPGAAGTIKAVKATKGLPVGMSIKDVSYRGSHTAPSSEFGAPLNDLTKIYPDDIYSSKAAQYYGHYGQGDPEDLKAIRIMQMAKGKPDMEVTIYRAIPYEKTVQEQIATLDKQMAAYMRRRTVPADSYLKGSDWYNNASQMRERLMSLDEKQKPENLTINAGDWVTLNRNYAKEHGEGALNGNYKIISKKVKAKDIYTDGNSIQEFGYNPAEKGTK